MMSFFQTKMIKSNYQPCKKMTASLQTHHFLTPLLNHSKQKQNIRNGKRMSFIASYSLCASITIEAAAVLPLFFCFFIQLLSAVVMIGFQSNLENAMYHTAREMAVLGYAADKIIPKQGIGNLISSFVFSQTYVKEQVTGQMEGKSKRQFPIRNGKNGLTFYRSVIMEKDMIDLKADYYISPFLSLLPVTDMPFSVRCRMRAWTGYDVDRNDHENTSTEKYVYITENGSVYHSSRKCSYLDLSVETIPQTSAEKVRNQEGIRYLPCVLCTAGALETEVYVTAYGSRYHNDLDCKALRRIILELPLSETGNKLPCTRCGGTE